MKTVRFVGNRSVVTIAAMMALGVAATAPAATITSFTYAYSANGYTPSGSYPDSTGVELNDDAAAGLQAYYGDAGWVGTTNSPAKSGSQAQPQIDLTFDQVYNFTNLTITYLNYISGGGIYPPSRVDLSFSDLGVVFSSPQSFTGFGNTSPAVMTNSIDLTGYSGRYIRAEFYGENGPWVFLSELDFTGAVPEPSSVALLGLGGSLVIRRRGGA
jgi:hypothetical protein